MTTTTMTSPAAAAEMRGKNHPTTRGLLTLHPSIITAIPLMQTGQLRTRYNFIDSHANFLLEGSHKYALTTKASKEF